MEAYQQFVGKSVKVVMKIENKIIFYFGTVTGVQDQTILLNTDNNRKILLKKCDISQIIEH